MVVAGKDINLAVAITFDEKRFREVYASLYQDELKLQKAWEIVQGNKPKEDVRIDQPLEGDAESEPEQDTKKRGRKGIHNSSES